MIRHYDSAIKMPIYRGRTPNCLPAIPEEDLHLDITSSIRLRYTANLYGLSIIAQDRDIWKELTQRL